MNTTSEPYRKLYGRKENIDWAQEPNLLKLRPYKLKELAALYGTCTKTMRKWLSPYAEQIGERKGHFYKIEQVKIIFSQLQPPSFLDLEEIGKI